MAIWPLRPTPQDLGRIAQEVAAITDLQHGLLDRDAALKLPDRVAHQYQIAGGKVILTIAPELPANLTGVGLFDPGRNISGSRGFRPASDARMRKRRRIFSA